MSVRLSEISKRKNSFIVNGNKFPLPRSIHRAVFYERVGSSFNWCSRVWKKFFSAHSSYRFEECGKDKAQPLPLYRMALAFSRNSNYQSSIRKLRQDQTIYPNLSFRRLCEGLESFESINTESREKDREKAYSEALLKQCDDQ